MNIDRDLWDELDALAEADTPREGDAIDYTARALELMITASEAGDIDELASRYGSSSKPVMVRPLSFVLAVAADDPDDELAQAIVRVAVEYESEDSSARVNLLTALHRLAIAEVLADQHGRLPDGVFSFVGTSLEAGVEVQSAALGLLTRLYEDGVLSHLSHEETQRLRSQLAQLAADAGDVVVASELNGLRHYLA